jgi:hypothetical protein
MSTIIDVLNIISTLNKPRTLPSKHDRCEQMIKDWGPLAGVQQHKDHRIKLKISIKVTHQTNIQTWEENC